MTCALFIRYFSCHRQLVSVSYFVAVQDGNAQYLLERPVRLRGQPGAAIHHDAVVQPTPASARGAPGVLPTTASRKPSEPQPQVPRALMALAACPARTRDLFINHLGCVPCIPLIPLRALLPELWLKLSAAVPLNFSLTPPPLRLTASGHPDIWPLSPTPGLCWKPQYREPQ